MELCTHGAKARCDRPEIEHDVVRTNPKMLGAGGGRSTCYGDAEDGISTGGMGILPQQLDWSAEPYMCDIPSNNRWTLSQPGASCCSKLTTGHNVVGGYGELVIYSSLTSFVPLERISLAGKRLVLVSSGDAFPRRVPTCLTALTRPLRD